MIAYYKYEFWLPNINSAIAQAFTSVSIANGLFNFYDKQAAIGKFYHLSFGVEVIDPYYGSSLFKHNGPKEAI